MKTHLTRTFTTLLVSAIAIAVGCGGLNPCPVTPPSQSVSKVEKVVYTSEADLPASLRASYYHLDEGIHYLPYDVLASMKRAKDERPEEGGGSAAFGLYDEDFLAKPERFGLFRVPGDSIPVGITLSPDKFPMAGINCSTCHTGLIQNASTKDYVVVDGAPSLFAINRFITAMAFSSISTVLCPSEFETFYKRYSDAVHRREPTQPDNADGDDDPDKLPGMKDLKEKVTDHAAFRDPKLAAEVGKVAPACAPLPDPTKQKLNRQQMAIYLLRKAVWFVSQGGYSPAGGVADLGRANPWGVSKNNLADKWLGVKGDWQKKPGGPISTPHIWGFNEVEHIFWAGETNSKVERDFAQGIALLSPFDPACESFETTVSIKKLHAVRDIPTKLNPPKWPTTFGAINEARRQKGDEVFKQECASCHAPAKGASPPTGCGLQPSENPNLTRRFFCDVGTDPEYTASLLEASPRKKPGACSSASQEGPGKLFDDLLGPFFGAVKSAAYRNEGLDQKKDEATYEGGRLPAKWYPPLGGKNSIVAKPLNGVWASAPYLHNGSVANMWELLQPAAKRTKTFYIGSIQYDPERLGFLSDAAHRPAFYSTVDVADFGSSAIGHEFGTSLTDEQKWALIEYLKGL